MPLLDLFAFLYEASYLRALRSTGDECDINVKEYILNFLDVNRRLLNKHFNKMY